jgi:hypothetical protein
MNGLARESAMAGGLPVNSPQNLMDMLRYGGAVPTASIHRLPNGEKAVVISWVARQQNLERIFFSNPLRCQAYVARAIESGDVPTPGELR